MVVDPKMLNSKLMKYNIWANVFNKLTWQQAQTPAQQPTQQAPVQQQPVQQQPETYKVITNKFPTYDVKDIMWFWPQATKNRLWFANSMSQYNRLQAQADANTDPNVRYNLTKPQPTNKETLQIEQATPQTNEQWLKINKTNSFKDLVADLQNVANQWRNLEFVKFRDLYPEYVENWDKVVDLFESIKSNPQYSAEQVTTTAQKAYPELFGINDNLSDKDKATALKKLYDEMVSNKQNWIQLTQQDIIDRYPEYANTEDINTVMEVQNLMNRDRKNTPTFNDIYENFESLTKWDVEVWNTEKEQIKKDLANLDKLEARQYNYLSDEWKEYVKLLWAAKAITDELKKNYWIPNDVSERDVLQEVKNKYPDIYSQLTNWVSENVQVSDKDRKLLDWGSTAKSAWKFFKWNLLEFVINTEAWLWDLISTLWNANADFYRDLATALWHWDEWNDEKFREWSTLLWDTLTRAAWWQKEDLESKQRYKEFQEENQKSFKQAMKDWDWTTMIWKSVWLIGQTLPALITSAASGWATWVWFATFLPSSYERALEDLEADESIKLTDNQKRWVALLMWSVESAIEEMSLNMMFPWLKAEWWLAGQVLNKIPWMKNALLRFAVQTELWAASESMEEVAQEFSNNLIARAAWSNRDMWEFSDYWDIFTETFLSSQLISALWWAGEWINQAKINQIQKQITEQADLRNKVLEWQAIMANDFNEFANAVEVVPWTTTEELQQVWNNAQQKKQELEEKANRITSNSYSNVATPTYERTTVKDTVKPKITANESQQYTDLLDEMIKNKEISEDDRKRVEKTLWVFTLNTEWEQDSKTEQQKKSSWLANINQNSNTNNWEKSNIISRSQRQLVQNYNRMNPKAIDDFKDQFKQDYGQFLVDRWFTKAWEDNLNDLVQYADTLLKLKDKALEPMQWRYQDRSLEDMLEMVVDRARNTKDYKKIEEYEKLLQKYNEWWIEVSEILSMMRWFNYKIKTWFFKEQNSEKLDLATNVYMATRDFLDKTAKENWLDSLDKLNREIRAVEHIIWWVTYKLQWSSANNMLWLNDYISLWAVIANPDAFAFAVTKLALKNPNVRNLVLRLAVGKRWNSKNRITESKLNDELNRINAIADQKARDAAVKDFNEKYWIDKKALPYKEWYNGTPTTTITVTPEWLSKTQWNVNTPNSEQKSQWLSETQKNSETENNTNEEVQDSIQDFLVWVWANETKQDLWNITTADYKNMSRRWLEQLLESDKIPAEEAKKITEELDWRKVKEESNEEWWWYLDHYYAYKINQLQEEEQRIGKVWNKKVNKSYAEEQMKAWEKKKEKLKEDMAQDYWDKDINRVEDKYGELESKPIDYINEWTKSKKFVVDEAEQQVIAKLQENWNKINRFELNMTEEEKKVREDILWKVSDLYETKSTDYGDSFVSRTNRDNRWIIYRDDGRVNVNSLDTLKSSGLYDVLPDDTKIAISWQEQTTLWELKKQPQGLAEVNQAKEQPKTEWLSDMTRQQKVDTKSKFVDFNDVDMSSKHESFGTDASDNSKQKNPNSAAWVTYYTASKMSDLDWLLRRYWGKWVNSTDFVASYTLWELLDNPALYEKYPWLENKLVVFADFHTNKKRWVNFMDTIYINSKIYEKNPWLARSTIVHEIEHEIQKYEWTYVEKSEAYQNSNRLWEDYVNDPNEQWARKKQQEYLDFIGQGNTKFQKWKWNPITKKQVNQLVKQLKKTWLAKDVKMYETQEDFEKAMEEEDARLQSVWHGSAASFDRFDSSHMWEWEWNQAHWWWHYVAVNEDTGRNYAEMTTDYGDNLLYKWKEINYDWLEWEVANKIVEQLDFDYMSDLEEIKKNVKESLSMDREDALEEWDKTRVKEIDKMINMVDNFSFEWTHNLYEVEIPDIIKKDTPTGSNYWEEDKNITTKQFQKIADKLREEYPYQYNNPNWWEDYGLFSQFLNFRQWWFSEKMSWREIYNMIIEIVWGDKEASKFLESLWYDGIHYFWDKDWEAYVIFNDDALQITNHIKYLKDTHWDIAWAVTPDGTVHLIESNLRWDTATHEFSHLLWSYAKKNNPNLYKALQKIAREAPQELKDYVKRTYGEMSDEAFLDEVFAWKQGKYSWIKTARTWYQRMWDAIKNIWNSIKNSFGSKYADLDVFEAYETMSSEELMDRVDKLLKWGKEIGNTDNQKFREQSVWHGSPYGFDRFDSSHMWEWEWAQAHGWWHYVAVDKETWYWYAKLKDKKAQYKWEWYRQPYSNERKEYWVTSKDLMVDRFLRELDNWEKFDDIMKYYVDDAEFKINDGEQMIATIEREWWDWIDWISIDEVKREIDYWKWELELLNSIKKEDFTQIWHHLYNVEIPDMVKKDTPTRSNYLEEDGKITYQQIEKLAEWLVDYDARGNWWKNAFLSNIVNDLEDLSWWWDDKLDKYVTKWNMSWKKLYEHLVDYFGGRERWEKQASKFLESMWYDWIHYFGGRDWEAYVIFNDNALQINDHIQFQKIWWLSNTQIKKFAVQQWLAEISKPQTKEYVVKNGKVWLSNMSIRMQLAEWSFDSYDSISYENKILSNKSTLQRLADESWVSYKKYEWGYTIDDALKELDDINSNKKWSIKESEIKLAKRDQIKDIIDLIDEWLWWEWNYWWFFDTKREYQWTPTILFRKWNDLANEIANKKTIAFHQPKNRKWYEHVPTRRLPISPTRSKKSK